MPLPELPIDSLLPGILQSLRAHPNLVLLAAPGAGKTTRVPAALLAEFPGEILVLEPRRMAARLAARRVAAERNEQPGETVGYQVRFEDVSSPRTRLRFVTEGVLNRRMLSDPTLRGVSAVVLDEFHERHLETDLALLLLRRLQAQRPELRLLVMSATLDPAPIARYLGDAPVLESAGRAFPLEVMYRGYSPDPLHLQVRHGVESLARTGPGLNGHILTFLPGAAEVRRAQRECDPLARSLGLIVLPLFGDLSPAEQDRAIAPSATPKLILSTNVAESSVTIDGVTSVIDSGLARHASTSPWTGLPTLTIGRVSKASARQRAGRAGRTAPGRALRLYAEEDFAQRPEQDIPEILRVDLTQLCLSLRAMDAGPPAELPWLDAPRAEALAAAEALLDRLGATSAAEAQALARFPLPPRLARMLTAAVAAGAGESACTVAALLSSGARFAHTDLLHALDHLPPDERFTRQQAQLRRLARLPSKTSAAQQRGSEDDLLRSVLAGFADRVGRRRAGNQVLLSNGVTAEVAGERPTYEFMVAVDAENRPDQAAPIVRLTSRIEPEWLLDLFPEHVRAESVLLWNASAERVDPVSRLVFDALVLEESYDANADREAVASLLAEHAAESGLAVFADPDLLAHHQARLAFAGLPPLDENALLRELCSGLRSFDDLRRSAAGLSSLLLAQPSAGRLRELAPESYRLAGGRQVKVHYEAGKPPWIASRLQDFFGMRETPRIGPERTPVVVELLAPNQRAVQMTSDLAGFWERLYPQVRRELMRRYPRHRWPENPLQPVAPGPEAGARTGQRS